MLEEFKKEFDARHDFDDEDIETFKGRWPGISFHNIPTAWIIVIDEMLSRMRYDNPVKEVRQEFGQLIVIHCDLKRNQDKIIKHAEQRIYSIDEDIRKILE